MIRCNGNTRASDNFVALRKILEYGHGRVCSWPDCSTVLRASNPDSYCGLHQPKVECERVDRVAYHNSKK